MDDRHPDFIGVKRVVITSLRRFFISHLLDRYTQAEMALLLRLHKKRDFSGFSHRHDLSTNYRIHSAEFSRQSCAIMLNSNKKLIEMRIMVIS